MHARRTSNALSNLPDYPCHIARQVLHRNQIQINKNRACSYHLLGSRLCALCVWLVAYRHLQFHNIDYCLSLTLWAMQRKVQQHSIFINFDLCLLLTMRTWHPHSFSRHVIPPSCYISILPLILLQPLTFLEKT